MKEYKSVRFVFLNLLHFEGYYIFNPQTSFMFFMHFMVNKSVLIRAIRGFIVPVLCRFGTCLIPVWYRFVSISIGIFPYVFLPQTSFLKQKRGFAPFPDFLIFTNSHLPGVQPVRKHRKGSKKAWEKELSIHRGR
jgi:hypothetical protein